MVTLHDVVEIVYLGISSLGAIVVVWGILESIVRFVRLKISSREIDIILENETLRQRLGSHLLLGLEIFIGADIVSSVVSPSWNKVGMLAAIVAIRTVLSYFLRIELKHAQRVRG